MTRSEAAKVARAAWQAKYGGTDQHREWCSAGYWATAAKLGWEQTNLKCFGQHLSKAKHKRSAATGYRQKMLWRV